MASPAEQTLISKLEQSSTTPIFSLFSNHLLPFTDLTNPDKPQTKSQFQTLTRSLAKQFLPFLNLSLSIIPKRLSDLSKSISSSNSNNADSNSHNINNNKFVLELFDTYRLCLDCLELIASQLSCKPYTVCIQGVRLVYCLEQLGFYKDAEIEGFRVLEKMKGLDFEDRIKKRKEEKMAGQFVPRVVENVDLEFAKLVVEVVVNIVKCVSLGQSKDGEDYRRVTRLVDEVIPWFRCVIK